MHNKPKKLTEDLFNGMEKVYERYSHREDFDPGCFAYSLARYTMYMQNLLYVSSVHRLFPFH